MGERIARGKGPRQGQATGGQHVSVGFRVQIGCGLVVERAKEREDQREEILNSEGRKFGGRWESGSVGDSVARAETKEK